MHSIISIVLTLILSGCVTPASVKNMVSRPNTNQTDSGNFDLKNSVGIGEIAGGRGTNPLWTSQVGNKEFKDALIESLKAHKIYDDISPKYDLNVTLISVSDPLFGFDFTIRAKSRIYLMDKASKQVVIDEEVNSIYTAKVSDNFIGTIRLRVAKEGAVRKNIETIIDKLKTFKTK